MENRNDEMLSEKKDLYESSNKFSLTKFVFSLKTSSIYFWTLNLLNLILSLACIVIYIYMTYRAINISRGIC